jgi:hypothetical protein
MRGNDFEEELHLEEVRIRLNILTATALGVLAFLVAIFSVVVHLRWTQSKRLTLISESSILIKPCGGCFFLRLNISLLPFGQ